MKTLEACREEINRVDRELAALFERRMRAVSEVSRIKQAEGLAVLDPDRERAVLEKGEALISDTGYKPYFREFMQAVMDISKKYQRENRG